MKKIFIFLLPVLLLAGMSVPAAELDEEIDTVLQLNPPPQGVVFEIVESDTAALNVLLPRVKQAIARLRKEAPAMDIAIVTHGNEQFALTTKNRKKYSKLHGQVQSLVKDPNVEMHVCGAYAEMKNVAPEEFPDYVDVSPSGPAQINNYVALGYTVIPVKK